MDADGLVESAAGLLAGVWCREEGMRISRSCVRGGKMYIMFPSSAVWRDGVMVSEQIRNQIRQERLGVEGLVRYCEVLAERHRFRHLGVRIIFVVAVTSGVASLLEILPQIFQLIAGFSIIALVAMGFVFNGAGKSVILNSMKIVCRALGDERRRLRIDLEQISDDDAYRGNECSAQRLSEATGWARHAEAGEDHELNVKCEELACNAMRERYAAG